MIEIKFRYWDSLHKTMSNGFDIYGGIDGLNKDIILMQYTGLKDKNGTEIYEWDIVECQDMHDSNIHYWGGETWQMEETKKPRYTVKWDEYRARFDYPYDIGYWKVIGNIYEPPTGA